MATAYEADVVAWSEEQSGLLRAGRLSALDIEHIADEVEDVGRSQKRELGSRLTVLLSHLLKWSAQPKRSGPSRRGTIKEQRAEVADILDEAPSLKARLTDAAWMDRVWDRAVGRAMAETSLENFPDHCPWTMAQILGPGFFPE